MEEERQIEKIEIVEIDSSSEYALTGLQLSVEELPASYPVGYDRHQARLLKLTPMELAFRRTFGQVVDFSIAYGGVLLYLFQSGAVGYNGSQEFIHSLSVNFSHSGSWESIWPLVLFPLPYLYLCWYFRDFMRYFTPGELVVGICRLPAAPDAGWWRWHFSYAFWQFCQVMFAFVWGIIVMTPLCSLLGLILLNTCLLLGIRRGALVDKATYMVVSGLLWIIFLNDKMPDPLRTFLCIFLCIVSPLSFALSVLYQLNLPADGNPIQSPCDLRYGIQSRAIRKLRKFL